MRWLRVVLALGVVVSMSGCLEMGYRMNEAIGLNCRPAALQKYGSCIGTAQVAK